MKKHNDKAFSYNILALSIAAAMLGFTGHAWADDDEEDDEEAAEIRRQLSPESEIELGVGHVSARGNKKYGDYSGIDKGGNLIANVSALQRSGNGTGYLAIEGEDLGLDSRSLRIEGGQQGNFSLNLEYSELPKLWSDSYQTPFVNPGDTRQVLPSGWVEAGSTSGMTQLDGSLRSFDVGTVRRMLGVGLTKQLAPEWDAVFNVKTESKEGHRLTGAVIGNSGGNPRAVILAEPVDYKTDQLEAILRHSTEKLQLQFGYYGSIFRDKSSALSWQNPYTGAWGADPAGTAANYPNGYGQLALPPDNQFHQLNASAGYTYSQDTRISGSFSIGRGTQDESFLPYSVNHVAAIPLPRNSLDGEIITTHADLRFSSRLTPKLSFTAAWRYDDRDNKTPQANYYYIGGDSQAQKTTYRTNLPVSSTKQKLSADLAYRLSMNTKLKLDYAYDHYSYDYLAVSRESEHTLKAGVNHRFGDTVSGGLSYAYSDRTTSDYDAGVPFRESFDPAGWPNDGMVWDNVPTQKKYFLAPRKRDKLRAYTNLMPTERLDFQLGLDYYKDDYHKSELGLREAKGLALNFDASLAASEALTANLFATLEKYESDQRSVEIGGVKGNYDDPTRYWAAGIEDRTLTLGAGLRYTPSERLELGGDLTRSDSKGKIDVSGGSSLAGIQSLPDVTSTLDRLDIYGRYWVKKDMSVKLKYVYERYKSKDWAYDGVLSNTMANVVGTNQESMRYRANMVWLSMSWRFQ